MSNIRWTAVIPVCAWFALSACSSAPKNESETGHQQTARGDRYESDPGMAHGTPLSEGAGGEVLAPGFQIRLRHLEDKTLNGSFRVNFNGFIDLPYRVTIKAAGMGLEDFRKEVLKAYQPYFRSGIKVGIELGEKNYYVDVRGLVYKPGRILIKADTTIDELIAMAGGFPTGSNVKFAKISNAAEQRLIDLEAYYKTGSPLRFEPWRGGETVFFQREESADVSEGGDASNRINLLGEVRKPGEITFRKGADIYYYLTQAEGPTKDSNLDKVEIIRAEGSARRSIAFDLSDPSQAPALKSGDIVIFHAEKVSTFQKGLTAATAIATIISTVALLILAL